MKNRKTYATPEVRKIEFDYRKVVTSSETGRRSNEPCSERFDDSRWNSPGLALCGYRYTA